MDDVLFCFAVGLPGLTGKDQTTLRAEASSKTASWNGRDMADGNRQLIGRGPGRGAPISTVRRCADAEPPVGFP